MTLSASSSYTTLEKYLTSCRRASSSITGGGAHGTIHQLGDVTTTIRSIFVYKHTGDNIGFYRITQHELKNDIIDRFKTTLMVKTPTEYGIQDTNEIQGCLIIMELLSTKHLKLEDTMYCNFGIKKQETCQALFCTTKINAKFYTVKEMKFSRLHYFLNDGRDAINFTCNECILAFIDHDDILKPVFYGCTPLPNPSVRWAPSSYESIVRTLEVLNARDLYYLDIKPANFIQNYYSNVVFCDYGSIKCFTNVTLTYPSGIQQMQQANLGSTFSSPALLNCELRYKEMEWAIFKRQLLIYAESIMSDYNKSKYYRKGRKAEARESIKDFCIQHIMYHMADLSVHTYDSIKYLFDNVNVTLGRTDIRSVLLSHQHFLLTMMFPQISM